MLARCFHDAFFSFILSNFIHIKKIMIDGFEFEVSGILKTFRQRKQNMARIVFVDQFQ